MKARAGVLTRDALIGYTGLVGSNLLRTQRFDALFRSTDIEAIRGERYDLLVCAGARAEKWKANQDPAADRTELARLRSSLAEVSAREAVLISTIDVFGSPVGVDEDTPIDPEGLHAYGRHRFELEEFFRAQARSGRFEKLHVVRLPGLFGPGLRKNAIYDLLSGNQLEKLHFGSIYQFYDLDWLAPDLERVRAEGLALAHLASEPVSLDEVARVIFREAWGEKEEREHPNPATKPARYDFRSRHGALWGRNDGYLYARTQVLEAIRRFATTFPPMSSPAGKP